MPYLAFEDKNIEDVSEALNIAEDKTGDYYKFSFGQWKRHHYDVKTLISLADDEITSYAFALLNKYSRINWWFLEQNIKKLLVFLCY